MSWLVYIIETDKGAFYTGITTNLERRWHEHCTMAQSKKGKGAKFFRTQTPKRIAYTQSFDSRSCASMRENEIKKMSSQQKRNLCDK